MHCKCCDKEFEPRINKITGQLEDLCNDCLIIAKYAALDINDDVTDDVEMTLTALDVDTDRIW